MSGLYSPSGSVSSDEEEDITISHDHPAEVTRESSPSYPSLVSPVESIPIAFSQAFKSYSRAHRFTYYSQSTDIIQSDDLSELPLDTPGREKEQECFWLDLSRPTQEEMLELFRRFAIHPLTLEDIQLADNREKCEMFEKYIFICIRTCEPKPMALNVLDEGHAAASSRRASVASTKSAYNAANGSLYILLFKGHVVSIHHEDLPHVRRVLRRMYALRKGTKLTADWLTYWLLDDTVDEFAPAMNSLQEEVDRIDEVVLFLSGGQHNQTDMLRRIGTARKRVTHLMRLLKPKTEIMRILTKRCPDHMRPHTLIYLRDVNDHVLTNLQNLEQYSETLNRSHNNYLAQISIELNEASNRMNQVMKTLTGVAALLLPLNLISGIWGMNVPVPGQAGISTFRELLPFFTIIITMLALTGGLFFFGNRRDWW